MESIPGCIFVGTVLGFLTGLGIGGGSLLILWLTQVLSTPQVQAQGINLLFFLPSAVIAVLFHRRQKRLRLDLAIPAMLCGTVAAGLCAWAATGLDESLMGKIFAFLLLASGAWELLAPHNKKRA